MGSKSLFMDMLIRQTLINLNHVRQNKIYNICWEVLRNVGREWKIYFMIEIIIQKMGVIEETINCN